jgi:hypothetical protein
MQFATANGLLGAVPANVIIQTTIDGSPSGNHLQSGAGWTTVATLTTWSLGEFTLTPIPAPLTVPVAAGATRGFRIDVHYNLFTSVQNLARVTAGTPMGTLLAANADAEILSSASWNYLCFVGAGCTYPFHSDGGWNGAVHYGFPEYALNSPQASLAIDGVNGNGLGPLVMARPVGTPVTLTASSSLGFPLAEIAFSPSTLMPAPASNQILFNLNGAGSQILFLNSGTPIPQFQPLFPISLTFNMPSLPGPISAQMIVLDLQSPSLVRLSQALQLQNP